MMRRSYCMALIALITIAGAARAQNSPIADSSAAADTATVAVHVTVRSAIDTHNAMQRPFEATPAAPMRMASSAGLGQSKALMIVGGAGLIAGAIVGGKPGTIIMVGGAVVGLYGLYQYLQ